MHHMEQNLVSASTAIHSVGYRTTVGKKETLNKTSSKINDNLTDFVGVFIHPYLFALMPGRGWTLTNS